MYGLAGERRLTEFALDHLPGYEQSRPVRIGNAASEQFQLDVYSEVLDAMHLARTVGIDSGATSWRLQRHLVEFVEKHWDKPANGLWEIRGPRRHFTHSKVMAWVAIEIFPKVTEPPITEAGNERIPEPVSSKRPAVLSYSFKVL
jgi:GH15 family glucan-1,4-alpha-glucosidase